MTACRHHVESLSKAGGWMNVLRSSEPANS
ncbi:hypothetical protein SAZ_15170 [Streptomyces noursei ZPM]|nr:hypothetical protein SAZ_15170 [Streptomyces noursei ZPM]EPY92953.1 hypothetical protein K530_50600 [Streptomyces noursei CCRC 11814]